uniref:Hypotheticial protein n=1 Tax=Schistosoma japonicum TaxID=6182 RepID=C1LVU8_SCHJA|nr:hypotheticial protein [Schistosoma japonicum]CAX78820.1 hypotheticial protein [Schistosoma japonicum]CAX78826.1 hypotheticial protein [Schistosoma japonicum]CAX78827.1 hypotheticial protein [Schistosoma japonicum]CAX78828.1 hypotheticial protein [Schistosoma japonicum]
MINISYKLFAVVLVIITIFYTMDYALGKDCYALLSCYKWCDENFLTGKLKNIGSYPADHKFCLNYCRELILVK